MQNFIAIALLVAPLAVQAQTEFPHPAGVEYYYVSCNATTWELNEQSRLRCEDASCISMFLEYDVTHAWMIDSHDTCQLVVTKTLDTWDETTRLIGAYVYREGEPGDTSLLEVPDSARFYKSEPFKVKYPETGRYRFWLTRARAAFSIEPYRPDSTRYVRPQTL